MATVFPFVIQGETRDIEEEDIARKVFEAMSTLDTQTLLLGREVCHSWRRAIDTFSGLWNRMPLNMAINEKRTDICKLIIKHSDDKNPASPVTGKTCLHLIALWGDTDICRLMLDNLGKKKRKKKNPADRQGITPLHEAVQIGHTDICKLIIDNVNDVNPANNQGCTPLHFAAGFLPGGNALKRTEVCQLIIDRVMDKNPADKYGGTPLHLAASGGRLQICQLILTNVLDKNPADSGRGRTPLHFAAANGHTEICKLILDNVQEKNPADLTGKTPLDLAKENGHTETCEIFEIALGSD